MQTKWQKIDPTSLGTQSQEIQGVKVKVFVPPFQMPEAVKGDYDMSIERFVIVFRYIEDTAELPVLDGKSNDGSVNFFIGKESKRLLRIEIDIEKIKVNNVYLDLEEKLDTKFSGQIGSMLNNVPSQKEYNLIVKAGLNALKTERNGTY